MEPLPFVIPSAVRDAQDFQAPDRVHLDGWIGLRIAGNEANRLVKIEPDRLLEGYRKRPGRQTWDGEHVGKWLHAATLAWANTRDPALRAKLDETVAELSKCQLADGYLGTYLEKDRWTEWDVWAHKYNLLGLLTYMQYTGNREPLGVCRKMADLLCGTFGEAPGQRDILTAGQHAGMAPTSVLEPMVLLYRVTGEKRYLDFCRYILRAWEHDNGPHIVSRLLEQKRVDKVGNAKAYEMLSCLNGALEYYRLAGDRKILDACLNAWQDIVDYRLYVTGTASYLEYFHDNFDLPNNDNVGETCVTVTWLQFNAQLLRLTGESRFAEQLEKVVLNHLFGAQRPDCAAWGYYVQMEGRKPYSDSFDGHCCLSSGPRGVSLIPTFAISTDADGVVVNFHETGKASVKLRDGSEVDLITKTTYPSAGEIRIQVNPKAAKEFTVKLRIPAWCGSAALKVAGKTVDLATGTDGYAAVKRIWEPGDVMELTLPMEPRIIAGDHGNDGKAAVTVGPLVLAADDSLMEDTGLNVNSILLSSDDLSTLKVTSEPTPEAFKTWPGARAFRVSGIARKTTSRVKAGDSISIRLVPFADVGATGARYKVWLPLPRCNDFNLLSGGSESRSREGNLKGSICDDDKKTAVVTFDGKKSGEDWFAVSLEEITKIGRVTFAHGVGFHNGGWFDTVSGKPKVQVRREKDGAWETVGELTDYPAASATDRAGIRNGQTFTLKLREPLAVLAVRVTGMPASGDDANQAFSSCGELQAFAE
ncbi:MAG: glycoside hydrolase family 127 protein [Luteolibacter sp.]|nr:glycoside hydrolase family 127 protein [Luteolibacter sp.]